jgi:hypothetical protein
MTMLVSISPAFAEAELEYRQQRIRDDYSARPSGRVRRHRFAAALSWGRRPNPATPVNAQRPVVARHHLFSRG